MDGTLVSPKRLVKSPTENRRFYLDFQPMQEIDDDGETLTGTPLCSATPSGLTIANVSYEDNPDGDETRVAADISSGTAGVSYLVRFTATTSGGATLSRAYYLDVKAV